MGKVSSPNNPGPDYNQSFKRNTEIFRVNFVQIFRRASDRHRESRSLPVGWKFRRTRYEFQDGTLVNNERKHTPILLLSSLAADIEVAYLLRELYINLQL